MPSAHALEAIMLICFGCSWPVAIAKTLRVRKVHGKSIGFLVLVFIGYWSGVASKFIAAEGDWPGWVTALYALNATMVGTEIVLYAIFRERADRPALDIEPETPAADVHRSDESDD